MRRSFTEGLDIASALDRLAYIHGRASWASSVRSPISAHRKNRRQDGFVIRAVGGQGNDENF